MTADDIVIESYQPAQAGCVVSVKGPEVRLKCCECGHFCVRYLLWCCRCFETPGAAQHLWCSVCRYGTRSQTRWPNR
jgi:hypothetical protein